MNNALALIVGNAAYTNEKDRLKNAVNDADDVAERLMTLGFTVKKCTDCSEQQFDEAIISFGSELRAYKVGLFFFAGHGLQIDGQNYLTAIDTSFADDTSAKHSSIKLDQIIEYMQKAGTNINIIILDACRDNPLPKDFRGTGDLGLAPVYAPKGTIIAFSTSPGEKAKDSGAGRNSIYTGAFLNHIKDKNIPIEEFFKRVRTSVYTHSGGKQTSWEHTSLIGTFYFNSDTLVHSVELPYKEDYVADRQFVSTGSKIDIVIEKLKSYTYDTQNSGIAKLSEVTLSEVDDSSLFLLGRNILQAAAGGSFSAIGFMENLNTRLEKYNRNDENHVLNGMLYEMFFDSNGHFRNGNYKSEGVNMLYQLQSDLRYKSSFGFIRKVLLPFKDYIIYWPDDPMPVLPIEVGIEESERIGWRGVSEKYHTLRSVKHEAVELLTVKHSNDPYGWIEIPFQEAKERLLRQLCAPEDKVRFTLNIPESNIKSISIPYQFTLSRVRGGNNT